MTNPVARLLSGGAMNVDLTPDGAAPPGMLITTGEARQRIAASLSVPAGRIRLVSPTVHEPLDDDTLLGPEVGVVVLCIDPEAERAAEAVFLQACGLAHMDELLPCTELIILASGLTCLPESFGQLTELRELYLQQNRLRSLPESFGELTTLQRLNLVQKQTQ